MDMHAKNIAIFSNDISMVYPANEIASSLPSKRLTIVTIVNICINSARAIRGIKKIEEIKKIRVLFVRKRQVKAAKLTLSLLTQSSDFS